MLRFTLGCLNLSYYLIMDPRAYWSLSHIISISLIKVRSCLLGLWNKKWVFECLQLGLELGVCDFDEVLWFLLQVQPFQLTLRTGDKISLVIYRGRLYWTVTYLAPWLCLWCGQKCHSTVTDSIINNSGNSMHSINHSGEGKMTFIISRLQKTHFWVITPQQIQVDQNLASTVHV